jgi:hypothetical protein
MTPIDLHLAILYGVSLCALATALFTAHGL